MIIKGSLNYDQHGRRRKKKTTTSRSSSRSRTLGFHPSNTGSSPVRDTTTHDKIPSHVSNKPYTPAEDNSWKVEISKQYTVAPAYNKGAYQVIPRGEVKDIGK